MVTLKPKDKAESAKWTGHETRIENGPKVSPFDSFTPWKVAIPMLLSDEAKMLRRSQEVIFMILNDIDGMNN